MSRLRILAGVAAILLVVASGTGYLGWRLTSATGESAAGLDLARTGSIMYVEGGSGRVRQAPLTRGPADTSGPAYAVGPALGAGPVCQRVSAGGGTLACLRATAVPMASELDITPAAGERRTLQLWGNPSRVRVSASGVLVGWTVFRTGDTYLVPGAFATTAGIFDLRTGAHHGSLEDFTAYVDGKPYAAVDRNFWGVTFAPDDRTFYATMATAGKTWLMRGDLSAGRMTAIRQNVECPSISPDGTRIAYKFRTGKTWRLHVLDVASGHDIALAEPDHVDDQPAWLDGKTVAYGKKGAVYAVPADGSGAPKRLVDGSSPSIP